MPRPASQETQIKNLTKELNLARGTILDNRSRIADLEKRLASEIERVATLGDRLQDTDHLQQEIVRLKAELNQAKTRGLIRVVRGHEALLEKMHRTAVNLDTQNTILRKALKEVL
jgi:GrpB-like predicted nucleotidyltransferase (UPF0157 family)